MAASVNLDALISREDFEAVTDKDDAPVSQTINVRNLEKKDFFYLALRKPDFQRETSEWEPKRVAGLIKTFIDGDLIPAVILWKNKEYIFVIDGSHRLSAIVAWVNDDYGDGALSQTFFNHSIPDEQLKCAERTRDFINKEIGSYRDHQEAAENPEGYGPDIVKRSRALGSRALNLQWVRGNAAKAEDSFTRINQQAAMITPQELELIQGRRKPTTIAARAIIRRGTGHQYWSAFDDERQNYIRELANSLHKLLFEPALSYPIKTIDLPAGGAVYSGQALRMVYDFVNLCVGATSLDDDADGYRTIECMKRCRRVAQLILSNSPRSLGLHPAVYFYSWTGKQQPILFLTVTSLIVSLEREKKLDFFIQQREKLETFIINNRTLLNQVIRKYGTKKSGSRQLKNFYDQVLLFFGEGMSPEEVPNALVKMHEYSYLQPGESPADGYMSTRYSTQVKSGLVMCEMLSVAPRCPICRGLIPAQAISVDHITRCADGGESTVENAQITHPYCNTGYKESSVCKKTAEYIGNEK